MNSDPLHDAIMNLPLSLDGYPGYTLTEALAHKQGFRDARHAAAELVAASAAAPQGAQPVQHGTAEDANNYCRILTLLGMEEEGDPAAEVQRLLADAAPVPQEVRMPLYGLVPPSAHEWLSNSSPPAAASTDWLSGWDACRNRVRTLVDAAMNAGLTIPEKEQR